MAKKDPHLLKNGEKVYAVTDLPGVPAGTPGRVLVSTGLTWIRYRVVFSNGVELGSLDRKQVVRRGELAEAMAAADAEADSAA